jgi:O-antigen/teichoic acid export membrane protein
MSVKTSIIKNGIAAALQKSVKVAEQLLLIPFFIQYWGAEYYGEWLTLTIIPTSLALADFGFGTAAANSFILKYAAGDKQGAADVSKTGVLVLAFVVALAIGISLILVLLLGKYNLFAKSSIPSVEAMLAVTILLVARILNFFLPLFDAYYRAARRASISINLQTAIALTNVFVGFLILFNGGKVVEYSIAILVVTVIFNPIYIFTARNILKLHKTNKGVFQNILVKQLVSKGLGYLLSPIWQAIYYQGMTFVVRLVLGPIAVTTFTTIRTLIRSSAQAFGMTITATFPDFQFENGKGNTDKAKKIFIGVLILNIIIALTFIIGLTLFGETVYNWWTKNTLHISTGVWIAFIIGIFFYALWFTFSFVFEAINKPFINTLAGFFCSIIAICLSWVSARYMGLLGPAISMLAFDFSMSIILLGKIHQEMDLKYIDFKHIILNDLLNRFPSRITKFKMF